MWLIRIGKEGGNKNHCPRMSKSAVDCAAAKGSRFAMHTACGEPDAEGSDDALGGWGAGAPDTNLCDGK